MLKIKYCRNVSVKADLQTGTQRIGLVTGQVGGEDRWVVRAGRPTATTSRPSNIFLIFSTSKFSSFHYCILKIYNP